MSLVRTIALAAITASLLGCPQQQEEAARGQVQVPSPEKAIGLDLRPHGLALTLPLPSNAQVVRAAIDEKEAAEGGASVIVVKAPDLTLSLFPIGDRSREQTIRLSGEGSVEGEGVTEAGRWVVAANGVSSTFLLWHERSRLVCRVENFTRPKLKDALKLCSGLSAP